VNTFPNRFVRDSGGQSPLMFVFNVFTMTVGSVNVSESIPQRRLVCTDRACMLNFLVLF
jgi:hypothetical protein